MFWACAGIGRQGGLKNHWWQHRDGSSPSTPTIKLVINDTKNLYKNNRVI